MVEKEEQAVVVEEGQAATTLTMSSRRMWCWKVYFIPQLKAQHYTNYHSYSSLTQGSYIYLDYLVHIHCGCSKDIHNSGKDVWPAGERREIIATQYERRHSDLLQTIGPIAPLCVHVNRRSISLLASTLFPLFMLPCHITSSSIFE